MPADEFIFGDRENARLFAKREQWRLVGRASWLKQDGTCVHFVCFMEQLAAVKRGERVYVVGKLDADCARLLKRNGVVVVQA